MNSDNWPFPTYMGQPIMRNFVVLFNDVDSSPVEDPMGFQCYAEDSDHAEEQCENAYPGCDVVWVWCGPEGVGAEPALKDYFTRGLEDPSEYVWADKPHP